MKDSVVILLSSYNGGLYIEDQINSLLDQINVELQIIIRDDKSSDDTVLLVKNMMKEHNNIHLIEGDINLGYKKSFKALLDYVYSKKIKFDYLSFCDQDDFWLPEKLECAISKIKQENTTSYPICYSSNLKIVDDKLSYLGKMYASNPMPKNDYEWLLNGYAYGCTIVINKEAFELIQIFKDKGLFAFDFYIPIIVHLFGKCIYDHNSYILYRQHGNNVIGSTRTSSKMLEGAMYKYKNDYYSHFASQLLSVYGEKINLENKKILETYANKNKKKLFFNKKIKKTTFKGTVLLKIMILVNRF